MKIEDKNEIVLIFLIHSYIKEMQRSYLLSLESRKRIWSFLHWFLQLLDIKQNHVQILDYLMALLSLESTCLGISSGGKMKKIWPMKYELNAT